MLLLFCSGLVICCCFSLCVYVLVGDLYFAFACWCHEGSCVGFGLVWRLLVGFVVLLMIVFLLCLMVGPGCSCLI